MILLNHRKAHSLVTGTSYPTDHENALARKLHCGLTCLTHHWRSAEATTIHPFIVISWSEREQEVLELLVAPQAGWTRKLLQRAKADDKIAMENTELGPARNSIDSSRLPSHLALFTGPHGRSIPVADYETVLLVSSGFGICSQLPYLRQLLYGYNARKVRTRRIHLVWVLENNDQRTVIQPFLNAALAEDTLDDGYILAISIYITSAQMGEYVAGRRVQVYFGSPPDLKQILDEERAGVRVYKGQNEPRKPDSMAVLVSAAGPIRDRIKKLVQSRVRDDIDLFKLEYQPA